MQLHVIQKPTPRPYEPQVAPSKGPREGNSSADHLLTPCAPQTAETWRGWGASALLHPSSVHPARQLTPQLSPALVRSLQHTTLPCPGSIGLCLTTYRLPRQRAFLLHEKGRNEMK